MMKPKGALANPAQVLTKALQLGLSATTYLMRERVTATTRHLYYGDDEHVGARNVWQRARADFMVSKRSGRPDASHLQRAEHSIRRSYNRFLFETSVRYGNTEERRKRRHEDRRYINTLADYLGARLRDISAEKFPFPPPARSIADDGTTRWVYPGSARVPEYAPTHTAPEQDFVDMIRSHGLELVRQCLRYSVPTKDARRYIDSLVNRLTPYLESVYAGRTSTGGRNNTTFVHGAARELRETIRDIQAYHGRTNGWPQSVTSRVAESLESGGHPPDQGSEQEQSDTSGPPENEYPQETTHDRQAELDGFFIVLAEKCDMKSNPHWRKPVAKIRQLVEQKILTADDAAHLLEALIEESRRVGAAFHDFVANADTTRRPFSLASVVLHGDTMLSEPAEFVLASEVPIAEGRGRADLVMFRRKAIAHADSSEPTVVWEPCVLVDIKTHCAFNLDMYAVPTKSKTEPTRRVVEFDPERRLMTKSEWTGAVSATPTDYEREQLDAYEKHVVSEYRRIARADTDPPDGMMKAVLIVDSKENWEEVRQSTRDLIMQAYNAPAGESPFEREAVQLVQHGEDMHAALIALSQCKRTETAPSARTHRLDPFLYSRGNVDNKETILYLTAAGRGSSQESAAKIAAIWHGLQYVYQKARRRHRDVLWLDLTGEYADPGLREQRLRLALQTKSLVTFVRNRVSFVDLSGDVSSFVSGLQPLSSVTGRTAALLQSSRRPLIVVTGFETIRRQMPSLKTSLLNDVIRGMIDSCPEGSTLIWFDRPIPLDQTSQRFDMRCLGPFYSDSPWAYTVDEIVWNLPMRPQRPGSHVPADDDVRLLVFERSDSVNIEQTLISPLHMWGERFRADKDREKNIPMQSLHFLRGSSGARHGRSMLLEEEDIEATLELVPHLLRFTADTSRPDSIGINRLRLTRVPSGPQSLLSRVTLVPNQLKTMLHEDGRVKRLEPFENINYRRSYRTTRLHEEYPERSTRPPHPSLLQSVQVDMDEIAKRELRGLRKTVRILRKRHGATKELDSLLDGLSALIQPSKQSGQDGSPSLDTLRDVRRFLETDELSRGVWSLLKSARSWCPDELSQDQRDAVTRLLDRHPDLLLFVGNDLFLLLLMAVRNASVKNPSTALVERLWEYVVPWQLVRLGFEPHYHARHMTGRSVYQRTRVLAVLTKLCETTAETLEKEGLRDALFGRCIPVFSPDEETVLALWFVFQTRPGSHEMSVALAPVSGTHGRRTADLLRGLPRERPYWSETNAFQLSAAARTMRLEEGVRILVGTYHGVQGLWAFDGGNKAWSPIGRFEYSVRRREPVTLLRSFVLREDSSVVPIDVRDVSDEPENLVDLVATAVGYVDAVFRECQPARCRVAIGGREPEFRVSFYTKEAESPREVGNLSAKRTADLLELLRRPDIDCEPVVVNGERLVWNRFRDIEYVGDTTLLRPWVERSRPFKSAELGIPESAQALAKAHRRSGVKLRVLHETGPCPLSELPESEIEKHQAKHSGEMTDYLRGLEGPGGQPDHLLTESVHRHGNCWRIDFSHSGHLSKAVTDLQGILLGGPALAALIRTGAFLYREGDGWVIHDFAIPDAKSLPPEFIESIHLVDAYREVVPEALKEIALPGAHLVQREEMWTVSVRLDRDHIVWAAKSDRTTRYLHGTTFTIPLPKQGSLEYVSDHVMDNITGVLPESKIRNVKQVRGNVTSMLEDLGHRRKKPDRPSGGSSEPAAPLPANVILEYEELQTKVESQIAEQAPEDASRTLDEIVAMLEPWTENTLARPYLMEALIMKAEILTSQGKDTGTSPESLLAILDRVDDLAKQLEARVITSRSPFAKKVRWALSLRETLRRGTGSKSR